MTRWKSADLTATSKAKKAATIRDSTKIFMPAVSFARLSASIQIGIDPGTHTGIAIKMHGDLKLIETVTIWKALNMVKEWAEYEGKQNTFVRVEDARLRTWFGKSGPERWKGAGSIGRDCAIWEEFLTELQIPFEMVHPKFVKETTADYFKRLTKWNGRTSKHAREAAWLIL